MTRPASADTLQCDPTLWQHMHDADRIKKIAPCRTVRGIIASVHTSDDGDVDMQLALDPPFRYLLNSGNANQLNGNLQIEAICQAPVHDHVPDARRACAGFTGRIRIPRVSQRVQVTGSYVLDQHHGWMEIHPISTLTTSR